MTGCSKKSDLKIEYSMGSSGSQYEIGNFVEPASAEYISDDLSVVFEEDNHMQDNSITALSALMFNETTNEVLFANNVYEKIYPASTTKILTALLAFK